MRRAFPMLAAVLTIVTGSCSDPAVIEGQREIAGELRALRAVLVENSDRAQAPRSAPAFDRAALTAAMEPTREVMTMLARDMESLQTRQSALTAELTRWSQLLAQATTSGNKAEVEGLVTRLQELEATMKQQDARHREVEDLLTRALDNTADRLEDFLKRVEEIQPPGSGAPTDAPAVPPESGKVPDANPGREDGAGDPAPATEPDERFGAVRRAKAQVSPWWLGVAGAALLVGGVFAWWLSRENTVAVLQSVADEPAPAVDDDAQELWAAATLLGEAVGRLRERSGGTDAEPPSDALARTDADFDDWFVIDESPTDDAGVPENGDADAAPAEAREAVAGPTEIVLRVAVSDPGGATTRALEALAGDPRVLPRPEPRVTANGSVLEIAFAVLPHLAMGERAHLELRVRDSVA